MACRNLASRYLVFFLFNLLSFHPSVSSSRLLLKRGDSFSVKEESEFITSPDSTFTCGFHGLGTNAYWFAIWFTNSRDKTVAWMANRDNPVNRKGSKITLRRDGVMVLTDVDGTPIWQTSATSTDAVAAHLLDTGNLVLKNHKDDILWQSFDFPTDTLLPTQQLTKKKRLTSVLRKGGYESGYFNLFYGSDNIFRMIYDSPDTSISYWPNPNRDIYQNGRFNYNTSRVAVMDNIGRFRSSDALRFNASDLGFGIRRRMTIDYDGNLRVYSLNALTGLWDTTWQALAQPCSALGVCGRFGICVYTPKPKCTCPPGYTVINPNDWSFGCNATFNMTILRTREVKFLEIPHTDYFGFDFTTFSPATLENCTRTCLEDRRCQGFSYRLLGNGICYAKSSLLNGFASPDFPASIYLKLPVDLQTEKPAIFHDVSETCGSGEVEIRVGSPSMYRLENRRVRWAYLYAFTIAIAAMEVMFMALGWWFLFRRHGVPASVEAGYRMILGQFRRYTYSELKKVTNNFKEELGRGGSGAVYKGHLSDGRVVAVKRLRDALEGQEEYWAEISTIGKINHMNLVRTWGFCSDGKRRLLVYEYVENLSLDRHLFGAGFLGWKQRYAVALGTAKGLAYLHHECLEWVIHCDVKPENIILDGDFQPKIADFGLAKLLQRGGQGTEFTRIRGTKGYMAPEWALNHPITSKVDVFGYGVVILELASGMRLTNWVLGEDGEETDTGLSSFVRTVKKAVQAGSSSWVESIVDPRLDCNFDRKQAATLILTGICCVEEDRNKRPTMATVVQTLLQEDEEDEEKEQPFHL